MKKINGYFAPEANEIKNAIKNARAYANSTGNSVQLWFDTVDGEFHKEEFVDYNSFVSLPEYCFNVGLTYGGEDETARTIENYLTARTKPSRSG